jgi:hypothetical protein
MISLVERRIKVVELFGEPMAAYLDKKHQGGQNGAKGGKFELFFAAHKIARLTQKLLKAGIDAEIETQSYSFIDDFVITIDKASKYKAFQLKNTVATSWTSGKHSIQQDFEMQQKIATSEGYNSVFLRLVSSKNEVMQELNTCVPNNISEFSKAIFFPYSDHLSQLIPVHAWLLSDFRFLSRIENCSIEECASIAKILMGIWSMATGKVKISTLLSEARQCSPAIIRTMRSKAEIFATLRPSCKAILDGIPNFNYNQERGFLSWEAPMAGTSGILPFDCFDPRFETLQICIERMKQPSFDDLEGLLI